MMTDQTVTAQQCMETCGKDFPIDCEWAGKVRDDNGGYIRICRLRSKDINDDVNCRKD